jgi:hypothetical protein
VGCFPKANKDAAADASADDAAPVASAAPVVDAGAAAKPAAAHSASKIMFHGTAVPTCTGGTVLVTEALSPYTPRCSKKCSAEADCPHGTCILQVNLKPDGSPASNPENIKACVATEAPTTPSAKPSASAAAPGAPPKCAANQHYDDISKKCRALGDCPAGYTWNDPMQSCIQQ